MKRNVDLTANRFFSDNNWNNGIITIGAITKQKFPWDASFEIITSDEDMVNQSNAVIVTGNKTTRAKKKYYSEMYNPNSCDCCGREMNILPWYHEIGICHICDSFYKSKEDKCKWRKKELITNARIF